MVPAAPPSSDSPSPARALVPKGTAAVGPDSSYPTVQDRTASWCSSIHCGRPHLVRSTESFALRALIEQGLGRSHRLALRTVSHCPPLRVVDTTKPRLIDGLRALYLLPRRHGQAANSGRSIALAARCRRTRFS